MSDFDNSTIENLKKLCHIDCSPSETEQLRKGINSILDYANQLGEVDTEGVSPCIHVLQVMMKNVVRRDEEGELLPREVFLANAPDQIGGMIRVPPILKESL